MKVTRSGKNQDRWLVPYHTGVAATSAAIGTAGRVFLMQFPVQRGCTIDAITYLVGGTSAGNVRAGIYRAVAEDTSNAATLVVQSSEVAQGSTNTPQTVSLTSTYLTPGRYYIALEFSDVTATVLRQSNQLQATGWHQYFDQTYGTLPSTVPAPTSPTGSTLVVPGVRVRVVQ